MPAALYSQLQQVALTGTRRLPLSKLTSNVTPPSNAIEHALHCVLTQADTSEPLRLLRAVAIAAVIERATWQETPVSQPEEFSIAPVDAQAPFAPDIVQVMRELMNSYNSYQYNYHSFWNDPRLLFLSLLCSLKEAKQNLPAELVVHALAMGSHRPGYSTNEAIRAYLAPVLGTRGYWLAQHNPAWQWAAWSPTDEDNEIIWQHGNVERRQALLLRERETNPDAARERLVAGFEQMNSKERIALIQTLATNLSMNDEPFLEGLLQRPGRTVGRILREKVAGLLDRLPQSHHSQRIMAIVQSMLQKDENGIWHIEPPEDFDPAWERDGISPDRFTNRKGQRAAYLQALVAHTPLSFWTQTTEMCAKELIHWAKKTNWKKQLHLSWLEALKNHSLDAQWIAAFASDNFSTLDAMSQLPQDQREAIWLKRPLIALNFEEIARCQNWSGAFLSASFSQHLITHIQLRAKAAKLRGLTTPMQEAEKAKVVINKGFYPLSYLVLYLDYSVMPEVATLLQTYEALWSTYFSQEYQAVCENLALRHKLHACQTAIATRAHAAL